MLIGDPDIDFMVVDVHMPNLDGPGMLRRLAAEAPQRMAAGAHLHGDDRGRPRAPAGVQAARRAVVAAQAGGPGQVPWAGSTRSSPRRRAVRQADLEGALLIALHEVVSYTARIRVDQFMPAHEALIGRMDEVRLLEEDHWIAQARLVSKWDRPRLRMPLQHRRFPPTRPRCRGRRGCLPVRLPLPPRRVHQHHPRHDPLAAPYRARRCGQRRYLNARPDPRAPIDHAVVRPLLGIHRPRGRGPVDRGGW